MEAAHRWGFDPNQPAAKKLLRNARAHAEAGELEVEIMRRTGYIGHVDRICLPGDRVRLPKSYADGLVEKGFARRFAGPS